MDGRSIPAWEPGNPLSRYERRKELTYTEQIQYQIELLKRELVKKVVTDVTYIKFGGKWFYLAAYLDLYNNEILEWELSDTFDNLLVMKPTERLLKRTESTERQVLLHSNQGVRYSSAGFCNLLTNCSAIQSMSRAGTFHDNAVMESFWAGSRMRCAITSVIGKKTTCTTSLLNASIILTTFDLFASSTENHQSCLDQNWWLDWVFVSTDS